MTSGEAINSSLLSKVGEWSNLQLAFRKAAKGKRGKPATAKFEFHLGDELAELQEQLLADAWIPGGYRHFSIKEPKRRLISAAPFRDRVIHHALCNVIEPIFERSFIHNSFANRVGKGTHRAIERFHSYSKQYRYVLRADIRQHFASIDHAILLKILHRQLTDSSLDSLLIKILESGQHAHTEEYVMQWFPGDDLLAQNRARGLPIGNLTSQFWSNCYLNPFDHFIKRELQCKAYLRYVDDFALFSDSKSQLQNWRNAIMERLSKFRLVIHEHACQVNPCASGVPWLGMVIYPNYRHLKARKARFATQHLKKRYEKWRSGEISFAELDASVKGWVNHASHADTWQLRKIVLANASTKRKEQ